VPAAAGHAAPTKLCSSHCVKRRRTASSAAADAICAHTARPRPLALPPVQAINPYFWHAFFTRTHLAHPQELPDVERAEGRRSRATKRAGAPARAPLDAADQLRQRRVANQRGQVPACETIYAALLLGPFCITCIV